MATCCTTLHAKSRVISASSSTNAGSSDTHFFTSRKKTGVSFVKQNYIEIVTKLMHSKFLPYALFSSQGVPSIQPANSLSVPYDKLQYVFFFFWVECITGIWVNKGKKI